MTYTIYTSYTQYWNETGKVPNDYQDRPEVFRAIKLALLAGMPEKDVLAFDVDTAKGRAELRAIVKELQNGTMEVLDKTPEGDLHWNKETATWTTEAPPKYNPNKGLNIMLVVDKFTNEVIRNDNTELERLARPLEAKPKAALPVSVSEPKEPALDNSSSAVVQSTQQPKETTMTNSQANLSNAPASVQAGLKTILDDRSSNPEACLSDSALKTYAQVKEFGQVISLPILKLVGDAFEVYKNQSAVDAIAYFATQRPTFYKTNPLMAWVKTNEGMRMVAVDVATIQRLAAKSPDETALRTSQRKAAEVSVPVAASEALLDVPAEPVATKKAKEPQAKQAPVIDPISEDLLDKLEAAYHTNLFSLRPLVNIAHLALGKPAMTNKDSKPAMQAAAEAILTAFNRSLPTVAENVAKAKTESAVAAPKSTSATLPAADIRKLATEKGIDISTFNMKSSKDRAKATALVTA